MARTLGLLKRISLEGLADGWDGCYVFSKPVTYGALKNLKGLETENMDEEAGVDIMLEFIRDHVAGGKIMISDAEGNLSQDDLQPSDVEQMSVEMVNHIFAEMTTVGAQYRDPKALATPDSGSGQPATKTASETELSEK